MNKILQLYGKNLTEDVKQDDALSMPSNAKPNVNPILMKYGSNLIDEVKKPKASSIPMYNDIFENSSPNNARTNYINQRTQELQKEYAPLKNDRLFGLLKGKSDEEINQIVNKNLQDYINAYDKEQANKNKTIPTNSTDYKEFYKNDVLGDSNLPSFVKDFAANVGLVNTKLQQNPITGRYIQAMNQNSGQQVTDDLGNVVEAPTTGNKILDTLIDIPANIGANIVGNQAIGAGNFYSQTGKVADNLINRTNLENPLLKAAARGGAENALQEGLMSIGKGDNVSDIAKNTLVGGLQGAAFGGALEAGGRGLNRLKNAAVTSSNTIEDGIKMSPRLKQVSDINYSNADMPLNSPIDDSKFKVMNSDIERPTNSIDVPIKAESQPLNVSNANDSINIPKNKANYPEGESRWKSTVQNDNNTDPELQRLLAKTIIKYDISNNRDVLNVAKKMIDTDIDSAIKVVKETTVPTPETNAMSQLLIQRLQKDKRYNEAIELIEATSKNATTQGQAIQALSMWGRLTPEGMLRHVQSTFDKANVGNRKTRVGNLGDKIDGFQNKVGKELKLTPELVDKITNEMTDISKLEDGSYEKLFKTASLLADIDEMVPKSVSQKLSTIQAMAQLLNPKTVGRNIIGNTLFGQGLENVSQTLATGLDKGIGAFTGNRTTSLPSLSTQAKSFKEGLSQGIKESLAGVNTTNVTGKYELGKQNRTFKRSTGLGKLETAMNVSLQAPDRAAYKAAYDDTLRSMTKANNGQVTDSMKAYADFTAKYRTFQDDSAISNTFKKLKKALNTVGFGKKDFEGSKQFGLGDLVLKYAKTPANIIDRALDYSPAIGVIKGIARDSKKIGTQKAFVDAMGRSLTGTGIMLLGYKLSKEGILTSKKAEKTSEDRFNRQIGQNPYSINIDAFSRWANGEDAKPQQGDKFISWDWAAPTALLFSMGGDIAQSQKENINWGESISQGLTTSANTLLEQPLFTGVQNLTSFGDLPKGLMNTALGAANSFTPTALKQIAQVFDNTARNTYDPSPIKQAANQVIAKIPGASKTLEPQITTFGEERKNYNSSGLQRGFDIFANPSFTGTYSTNETTQKIKDIAESTGDVGIYPKVADKKITLQGQTVQLTAKELKDYQQKIGQQYLSRAGSIVNSSKSDQDKAKQLESLLRDINTSAKEDIFRGRNITLKK
ncbi:MAG: hypothetical protein K0S61_697 [Anaerocolumna sp.]|jgi:hypothetical protein|nr:hypothetical protein [Anaerocolumna sp.]